MMLLGPICQRLTMLLWRPGTIFVRNKSPIHRSCNSLTWDVISVLTIPTDDPEIQVADPEGQWVNYFAFLGRLVAAEVTPDWWEIPAITIKEVLAEDITPTHLTKYKTMALAEFMNQAGDRFVDWCIESGTLDVKKNIGIMAPLMKNPIKQDWLDSREIVGKNKRISRRETR